MPKQALIMIDMQRGFLDSASPLCIPAAEGTVPACAALIDRCHEAGVPVIYAVRHYRADGTDVEKPRAAAWASGGKPLSEDCAAHLSDAFPAAFTVLPQDYVLVKPRFSAFFHTSLDLILRRLGVQTVLLAGTTTPNCIRTTCYDAISVVMYMQLGLTDAEVGLYTGWLHLNSCDHRSMPPIDLLYSLQDR